MEQDNDKPNILAELNKFEDSNLSYLEYLESHAAKGRGMNPTSAEAFQVQADYLKALDHRQHPFDVLRRISLNPWCSPRDRIAACKSLLEYSMAKMPSKVEVSGNEGKAIQIDASALKNLSGSELDQMIKLLDKMNNIE